MATARAGPPLFTLVTPAASARAGAADVAVRLLGAVTCVVRTAPDAAAAIAAVPRQDAGPPRTGPPRGEGDGPCPLVRRLEADAVGAHAGAVRGGPRGPVRAGAAARAATLPKEAAATKEGKGQGRVTPPPGGRLRQVAGAPAAAAAHGEAAAAEAGPRPVIAGHPDAGGHLPEVAPADPLALLPRPGQPRGVRVVQPAGEPVAKATATAPEVRPGVRRPLEAKARVRPRPGCRTAAAPLQVGPLGAAAPSRHFLHVTGPVAENRPKGARGPIAARGAAGRPETLFGRPTAKGAVGAAVLLPVPSAEGPVKIVGAAAEAGAEVEAATGPFAREPPA